LANTIQEVEQIERLLFEQLDRRGLGPHAPKISKALAFAKSAHAMQYRDSGEPYVVHPLQVAIILLDMLHRGADPIILQAALLHDVLEDNLSISRKQLVSDFGEEVVSLVDGVTKIGGLPFGSPEAEQSENFRKMLLSMAKDIRVILIKLADRLHNMRSLDGIREEHRRRSIATVTREIYAPLAHRLGMAQMKWELEDLSFKYLEPENYGRVKELVAIQREEREGIIEQVRAPLMQRLKADSIRAEVIGRPKSFLSIWNKMQSTGGRFHEIYDLLGLRVLTERRNDCYLVMGVVHDMYYHLQHRFRDYIAAPKSNLYQSIHTTVIGPDSRPVEIQIRTRQMHAVAEYGIAAHYKYKEGGRLDPVLERHLGDLVVRGTTEWQEDADDPKEFMALLKISLYHDEVFAFTPRGELKQLPLGATPIDFAYAVHSDVGNHCVGARVNGRLVSLRYELKSGDMVEILTSASATPSEDWLKVVRTSRARAKVRYWLKQQRLAESITLGREILARLLRKRRRKIPPEDELLDVAQSFGLADVPLLFAKLGEGHLSADNVVTRIYPELAAPPTPQREPEGFADRSRRASGGVRIQGISSLMVSMAQCCRPVPGDPITGIITRGRGVSVHRQDCPNTFDDRVEKERRVDLTWDVEREQLFLAHLGIHVDDRPGMLADLASAINRTGTDIRHINMDSVDGGGAVAELLVEVRNLSHLEKVRQAIMTVRGTRRVERKDVTPQEGTEGS